jgi:hypothetical protein
MRPLWDPDTKVDVNTGMIAAGQLQALIESRAQRIHARETIELDTSHASFATRPTQVLELITNAASAI